MGKKVSIIMPVYNGEKLIEESIERLRKAGNSVLEIIIVNDGSTDRTYELLQEIEKKDESVHVINTENHGIYTARLTGLKYAKGEYIAFADADDSFCLGAIDLLVELLEEHNADIAMGHAEPVYNWSEVQCRTINGRSNVEKRTVEEMWPRIMRWGTQEFICYTVNKLYKKDVFSNLIECDKISQGEDVFITCQVFLNAQMIVETSQTVYLYYQNPESITHRFGDRDLDLIRVWDNINNIMQDQSEKLRYMAQINRWRTDFTLICRLILACDKNADIKYSEQLKQWRGNLKIHYKDLLKAHSLPKSRQILIYALRFAYQPTKMIMRFIKKASKNIHKICDKWRNK